MFIIKEDLKTIFRRLDEDRDQIRELNSQVKRLTEIIDKKHSTCEHKDLHLYRNLVDGKRGFLVCLQCNATIASGLYDKLNNLI